MSTTRRALHELDKPFTWFRLKLGPQTFTRTPPLSAPLFLPFFFFFFFFFHFFFFFFCSPIFFPFSFPSSPFPPSLFLAHFFSIMADRYEIRATPPCKSVIACRGKGCFDVDTKRGPSLRGNERKRSQLAVRMRPETCHLHRGLVISQLYSRPRVWMVGKGIGGEKGKKA